jgi:hypothetical protein
VEDLIAQTDELVLVIEAALSCDRVHPPSLANLLDVSHELFSFADDVARERIAPPTPFSAGGAKALGLSLAALRKTMDHLEFCLKQSRLAS